MGLLSNRIDKGSLKPGDHIYSWRAYVYAHHGIYVGNDKVIHFTRGQGQEVGSAPVLDVLLVSSVPAHSQPCSTCPPLEESHGVISSCLDCFLAGGVLYRFEYGVSHALFLAKARAGTCTLALSDPDDIVLYRAFYLLNNGFGCYNVFKNNCEHFAIYCKTSMLAVKRGPIGQSGQAISFISAPLAAFLPKSLRLITTVSGMAANGIWVYCASRYAADIGMSGMRVAVEDLAARLAEGRLQVVEAVGATPAFTVSCLDPESFKEFKLVKRTQLSHNVAEFRFALPTPASVLGLPIGQQISCKGKDSNGEEVIKPYTPTTLDSDVGYFELVIKMYPQGRMSNHFREMCVGDYLAVKSSKGRFKYQSGQVKAFGMLARGSGITPMFRVTRAILENPKDKTNVYLIYANVTLEDILLKKELDGLASNYPDRFKVYYVLNQPPEVWNGGVGLISKEMIKAHCPAPAPDIQILRCGPPPMNKAMAAHLDDLGYTPKMQFQF